MVEYKHKGMADASSAVAIGDDRFLVVSDEKNEFLLFKAFENGEALKSYDFASFLDLDEDNPEADIEGSAELAGITYWIGSHSRDKHGALCRSRHQFFGTFVQQKRKYPTIRLIGQSYTNLIYDMLDVPEYQVLMEETLSIDVIPELASKKPGALSIEGLTRWGDGVLVGFRNPVPYDIALLMPVENPLAMILYGDRADIGRPVRLDLDGRGVRSIDYLPAKNRYLICAGSSGNDLDAAYYLWDGSPSSDPEQYNGLNADTTLNTEAVVTYPGKDGVQLLSDDGRQFKDKVVPDEDKWFRSQWLKH
ncbi:MAG: DUF3616 domain-containing protein [Candidatus Obscuribacterales bacterium]